MVSILVRSRFGQGDRVLRGCCNRATGRLDSLEGEVARHLTYSITNRLRDSIGAHIIDIVRRQQFEADFIVVEQILDI